MVVVAVRAVPEKVKDPDRFIFFRSIGFIALWQNAPSLIDRHPSVALQVTGRGRKYHRAGRK
jgi:hypothetical protein